MWEYVKGSEADFEGVSDIAVMILRDKDTMLYYVKSADPDQKQKIYCFSLGSYNTHNRSLSWWSSLSGDSTINTYFSSGRYEVIAERRKVDNLQSRVNDANLQQAFQNDKYNRPCKGVTIDVYDVLNAFNVTNPALQHLIKKALAVGQRGHKDKTEDLNDILASAKRAIELEKQ